jgi:glycosyltransferase involved in cell wall biosynthesis
MHIISGDLWAGAEVQAYTLLKQLRETCDLHVVLMNHGELADRLGAVQIPLTILDETRLGSFSILLALRKCMRSFAPDVIHTHRQKENILGNIANLLSVRAKSVRTSHGAPEFNTEGIRRLQSWLDTMVGRHLQQAIIAVSADLAVKLTAIFPPRKIHIINNGVDVEALKAAASEADFKLAEPDTTHIGIIGRLEPVKRIDIFLKMAAILMRQAEHKEYRFHVIGDGKLKPQLEAQTKELGLSDVVRFHGHRKDMASCISSLDVIVMCSDHEGTPMTALEALALGVPLVAHDVGGLREILVDYPALLVNEHVPGRYAQHVKGVFGENHSLQVNLPEVYFSDANARATYDLYEQNRLNTTSAAL